MQRKRRKRVKLVDDLAAFAARRLDTLRATVKRERQYLDDAKIAVEALKEAANPMADPEVEDPQMTEVRQGVGGVCSALSACLSRSDYATIYDLAPYILANVTIHHSMEAFLLVGNGTPKYWAT